MISNLKIIVPFTPTVYYVNLVNLIMTSSRSSISIYLPGTAELTVLLVTSLSYNQLSNMMIPNLKIIYPFTSTGYYVCLVNQMMTLSRSSISIYQPGAAEFAVRHGFPSSLQTRSLPCSSEYTHGAQHSHPGRRGEPGGLAARRPALSERKREKEKGDGKKAAHGTGFRRVRHALDYTHTY